MADRGYQIAQVQAPDFTNAFNMMDLARQNRSTGSTQISNAITNTLNNAINDRYAEAIRQVYAANDPVAKAKELLGQERYANALGDKNFTDMMEVADTQSNRNFKYWGEDSQRQLAAADAAIQAAVANGDIQALKEANLAKEKLIAEQQLKDTGTWGDTVLLGQNKANLAAKQIANDKAGFDLQKQKLIEEDLALLTKYTNTPGSVIDTKSAYELLLRINNDTNLSQAEKDRLALAITRTSNDARQASIYSNTGMENTLGRQAILELQSNPNTYFSGDTILSGNAAISSFNENVPENEKITNIPQYVNALQQARNANAQLFSNVDKKIISGTKLYTSPNFDISSTNWSDVSKLSKQVEEAFGPPEEGESYAKFYVNNQKQLRDTLSRLTKKNVSNELVNFLLTNMLVSDSDKIISADKLDINSAEMQDAINTGIQIIAGTNNGNGIDLVNRLANLQKRDQELGKVIDTVNDSASSLISLQDKYNEYAKYGDSPSLTYVLGSTKTLRSNLNDTITSGMTLLGKSADDRTAIRGNPTADMNNKTVEENIAETKELDKQALRERRALQKDAYVRSLVTNPTDGAFFDQETYNKVNFPNYTAEKQRQQDVKETEDVYKNAVTRTKELTKELKDIEKQQKEENLQISKSTGSKSGLGSKTQLSIDQNKSYNPIIDFYTNRNNRDSFRRIDQDVKYKRLIRQIKEAQEYQDSVGRQLEQLKLG